jgi:undecaprenyl pyrophosphate phosphatase UppP
MNTIPLTVLSFFCLSLLFLIAFISSTAVICKFSQFIPEARIAKFFYINVVLACLVRSACFGAATGIFIE